MNSKKVISSILSALLLTGMLSGCSTKGTNNTSSSSELKFPLKQKITITDWIPFSSTVMKSLDENVVYQELEKKSNIHIKFIHPTAGQEQVQFNLMIASNQLPDLIQYQDGKYPGGPDKAIDDKVYLKLNDLIDKYAPNYKKLRNSNPEVAKETITDAGNIYCFNCIQKSEEPAWNGLIIRKDWLDELGLKMPQSMDDWHTVLKAFKEQKKAEVPLIFNGLSWQLNNSFALVSAYNVTNNFFNQNGTVKFGVVEPGYKEFLTTLNQWYKEGLIDKDFATRDDKSNDALFTSGKAGAMYALYGSFGTYNAAGKKIDPKFAIAGVANVPKNAGDKVHLRQTNGLNKGSDTIITTSNKYPKETVMWLDYAYSDDGFLLYNYGVQGKSWDWKQGPVSDIDKPFYPDTLKNQDKHPEFNDFMLKNPDGVPFWDLVQKYKIHQNASLRDPMANGAMDTDVKQAMTEWSKPGNDWVMPPVALTNDESQKLSPIMSEINTYVNEEQLKFIMGVRPISDFDNFVSQIKKMKIDDAIKIQQAALDRYNKRK